MMWRDEFLVSKGANSVATVRGIASPFPGLAITEAIGSLSETFPIALTHVASGHALGHFPHPEAAAGAALAVSGLIDWLALDQLTEPEFMQLGEQVRPIIRAWNGTNGYGLGDRHECIEERIQ